MTILAQLILWIDDQGVIHCESPGKNGSREKVDIDIPPILAAELQLRASETREKNRLAQAEVHRQIWDTTAEHHGMYVANKFIGPRKSGNFFGIHAKNIAQAESAPKAKKSPPEPIDLRLAQSLNLDAL